MPVLASRRPGRSAGAIPSDAAAALLGEGPDLIRICDDDQMTVFVSEASTDLLGYRPDELVGTPLGAFDHPDDRSLFALGRPEARQTGHTVRRVHRVRHRDGDFRWLETTARVLSTHDDQTYTVFISRDATGLQELVHPGRLTRERLATLVEAIPDRVVLIDADGRILAASSAWLALVAHPGPAAGEPIEAVCRWTFGADAARRVWHAVRRTIRREASESLTLSSDVGCGGEVSVECTPLTTPVLGGVEDVLLVFQVEADQPQVLDPAAVERVRWLTPRERDVLRALADGLSSRRIAARLGICENTVRGHIKSLLQKLQVHTRLQAVLVGIHAGVVPLDGNRSGPGPQRSDPSSTVTSIDGAARRVCRTTQ